MGACANRSQAACVEDTIAQHETVAGTHLPTLPRRAHFQLGRTLSAVSVNTKGLCVCPDAPAKPVCLHRNLECRHPLRHSSRTRQRHGRLQRQQLWRRSGSASSSTAAARTLQVPTPATPLLLLLLLIIRQRQAVTGADRRPPAAATAVKAKATS